MAKQTINIGTAANSKNGDPLRTAFTKVNANFTELYAGGASETQLTNGAYTVTLGSTGNLTWAGGAYIGPNGGAAGEIDILAGTADGAASLGSYDLKNYMYVDNDGPEIWSNSTNVWKFGLDGILTFPDATVQTTAYTGTSTTRSAGSVAGAGTVTLNYSTDRLVRATATGSTLTIAHSNITAGKTVDLVISNTSGASCTVTYGVPTGNTIGGTTTFAIGNGTTHVFTSRSFGTTTTDVYVTVV
jgi:hypothetical protein